MAVRTLTTNLYSSRRYNSSNIIINNSVLLDGNGDYLSIANNNAFKFGAPSGTTNDFTVEFFAYPTTTTETYPLTTGYDPAGFWMFGFGRNSTAGRVSFFLTDNFSLNSSGSAVTVNSWNHIAASRSGTTVGLYVNGTRVASGTSSINPNPTKPLYIGYEPEALGGYFTGNISNVRIVKGTAVYTGTSLTVPTSALEAITNTTVLVGTAPTPLLDVSTNALTVSVTGNAAAASRSPF